MPPGGCARSTTGTLRPSVAVLMIDLDHFKKVNDDFGHSVGDLSCSTSRRSILEGSRRGDIVVRYGGEEFVVVLSGVDLTIAQSVAERIRETVTKPDDGRPSVTASVGVACATQGSVSSDLVERADKAMYFAKASGRDQVGVAE